MIYDEIKGKINSKLMSYLMAIVALSAISL